MRSIKFRGKSTMSIEELNEQHFEHEDGWFYGNLVMYGNTPYIVGDFVEVDQEYTVNDFWMPAHPKSLGQFTGLTDKNGKEVYEGDVVKRTMNDSHINIFIGKVIFHEGTYFIVCGSDCILLWPSYEGEKNEIIGNIYQHPHLLEESK